MKPFRVPGTPDIEQTEASIYCDIEKLLDEGEHERIAQDLDVDFFFAHPYAAWERGANENMNGLVRQYIPKNRALTSVTEEEMEQIMNKLNYRPRKCLDFKSPYEVFFSQSVALVSCIYGS